MKNQSFHPRKIRISDAPQLNPAELKNRTIIALNKLGAQKFSDGTGGYSLDNWAKGINILLDDFEEKIGEERLPSDYFAKRRELNDVLSKPVSTPLIDAEISEVKQKMADANGRVEAEKGRLVSRISDLENEQAERSAELEREQERISKLVEKRNSGSFFRRLVSRNPESSQDSRSTVDELEARIGALEQEILEKQKLKKSIERHSLESASAEDWKTLESLQAKLEALERAKSESVQLVRIREEFAASMAETISKISS